jgi:hypothetical protein
VYWHWSGGERKGEDGTRRERPMPVPIRTGRRDEKRNAILSVSWIEVYARILKIKCVE